MIVHQTRVSNANMMTLSEKLSRFLWGLFLPMCIVLAISFDCSTCVERRKALVEAGIPYPTDYE